MTAILCLQQNFPSVQFFFLKGNNIRYTPREGSEARSETSSGSVERWSCSNSSQGLKNDSISYKQRTKLWGKVSAWVKCLIRLVLISSFSSMNWLEVFLLPPGWDASPLQGYPSFKFGSTHSYTWMERGTVRVQCLAQEHNTMFPARAQTCTAWTRGTCTNHEATMPLQTGEKRLKNLFKSHMSTVLFILTKRKGHLLGRQRGQVV